MFSCREADVSDLHVTEYLYPYKPLLILLQLSR